ncbi:hypothetical protein AJ78_08520 [Emergomyces pasteurianus Ep9510]|uniref:Uncharacterized protein n=1 Tax=Emergomyces pasteurianus Ep9510 TaxID=1447872 RepID=A0A1J9P3M3_9EURO|nr:hypothetical protein AJ78_08520 [Emergomyces pasteurianus Ep9510]
MQEKIDQEISLRMIKNVYNCPFPYSSQHLDSRLMVESFHNTDPGPACVQGDSKTDAAVPSQEEALKEVDCLSERPRQDR